MDFQSGRLRTETSQPATPEQIAQTIKVMGGEDWTLWVEQLLEADLLAEGFQTVAFSYIGPAVTRASAVIPGVPLYVSLLYKVMKAKGLHENCIQQIHRLYRDFLFSQEPAPTDDLGRLRLDDWEMQPDVQADVARLWQQVNGHNISQLADLDGFREEFLRHHGFGVPGIDYSQDVTPQDGLPVWAPNPPEVIMHRVEGLVCLWQTVRRRQ